MRRIENLRAEDVMTKNVTTVRGDTSIKELKQLFAKHDFNGFPVADGDKYLGIVYKRDLLRVFVPSSINEGGYPLISDYWKLFTQRVGEIMERAVVTCSSKEKLPEVVQKMIENKIDSIAVVDQGKLRGIIALKDLIGHLFVNEG